MPIESPVMRLFSEQYGGIDKRNKNHPIGFAHNWLTHLLTEIQVIQKSLPQQVHSNQIACTLVTEIYGDAVTSAIGALQLVRNVLKNQTELPSSNQPYVRFGAAGTWLAVAMGTSMFGHYLPPKIWQYYYCVLNDYRPWVLDTFQGKTLGNLRNLEAETLTFITDVKGIEKSSII